MTLRQSDNRTELFGSLRLRSELGPYFRSKSELLSNVKDKTKFYIVTSNTFYQFYESFFEE